MAWLDGQGHGKSMFGRLFRRTSKEEVYMDSSLQVNRGYEVALSNVNVYQWVVLAEEELSDKLNRMT